MGLGFVAEKAGAHVNDDHEKFHISDNQKKISLSAISSSSLLTAAAEKEPVDGAPAIGDEPPVTGADFRRGR